MNRIAPENWYQIKKIGEDVTYISEPYIKEFYRCNIWHVRGSQSDMLVDSGMGVVSLTNWVSIVTEKGGPRNRGNRRYHQPRSGEEALLPAK